MEHSILTIDSLTAGYETPILHNISFEIKPGEIFGIIGPNGSGKTTLLKSIASLLKPMSGHILWKNDDLQDIPAKHRARQLAVVSQTAPKSSLSVKDYVMLGRIPHLRPFQFAESTKDLSIVEEQLELTRVSKLRDKPLATLSGGERQLVHIARAFAQEPQALLLDEPTTHLDIAHQVRILDLLKEVNLNKKLTIVIVFHDLNLAAQYCHRLCLLDKGVIKQIGKPKDVLTQEQVEKTYDVSVEMVAAPTFKTPLIALKSMH
jgi:iron complex transport system ATP-binding protein